MNLILFFVSIFAEIIKTDKMNALNIGDLKIKLPIIQGGMGVGVSLSGLAAAVANEGGVGVISAVGIGLTTTSLSGNYREANVIALRNEIKKARLKTDGIVGVNLMMAVSDFDQLIKTAFEEEIDIVFIGAGLLLKLPPTISQELLKSSKTKIVPKVSSARAAKIIFQQWSKRYNRVPDAVVVEGPLAGGHQGFKKQEAMNPSISLSSIVSETIKEVKYYEDKYGVEIPVIAGGGIYSGKDMFDVMKSGAKGVKIGTRFVTTHECDAAESFKQNYLACSSSDITIIDSPVGLPGRVISNDFVKQIQDGKRKPINCSWKCLKNCDYKKVQFCIADALYCASKGDFVNGFSFAGTNAYLAKKITSVKDTVNQIIEEYVFEEKTILSN